MIGNVFDRYHARYDAWYDRNRFAYLSELAALKKEVPAGGKGLEIGVGTGRFAAPLGIQYGVDPSEKMLRTARDRGIFARRSSGEDLPFDDGSFDHVALIVTLSFVRDPGRVLREAFRVLKGKGKIIIGMVDGVGFLGRYYIRKKGVFYKNARLMGVGEVTGMLEESGFGGFSYHQTVFRLPGDMRSVHKTSPGYGRGGFVVISAVKKTGK